MLTEASSIFQFLYNFQPLAPLVFHIFILFKIILKVDYLQELLYFHPLRSIIFMAKGFHPASHATPSGHVFKVLLRHDQLLCLSFTGITTLGFFFENDRCNILWNVSLSWFVQCLSKIRFKLFHFEPEYHICDCCLKISVTRSQC